MKLLDRDLIAEFFKTYFWFVFILAFIFFVDIFLDLFQEVAEAEESILGWAFLYYLCRLPRFLVETGVIAVSTSILWVITRKARSYELMAYMAGGISPVRMAAPLLLCAAVISVGSFFLNEYVRVDADRRAVWIEEVQIKQKDPNKFFRSKFIHSRGGENRFYFVDEFNSTTQTMTNATIIDLHPDSKLPRTIVTAEVARFIENPSDYSPNDSAESGDISADSNADESDTGELIPEQLDISEILEGSGDEVWEFRNGSVRAFDEQNQLVQLDTFSITDSRQIGIAMDSGIKAYLSDVNKPDEMAFNELLDFIKLMENQNKSTNLLKLELYTKIALPLAIIFVAMVICSHVLSPKSTGIVAGFGGGLGWIAGYYVLFLLLHRFEGLAYEIPPIIMAIIPDLIYGGIGSYALYKRHFQI